ncbi:MAG TPA: ATP-binding protein [Bryobacteraceae bacterium]|nr:ATP-binding protein [Bryobacteraceae bacterium]
MTNPARFRMLSFFLRGGPKFVLLKAAVLIAVIAFIDWRADRDVTLGFLYLFPMLMVGSVLRRWQIVIVAGLCTFLAEVFDSFEWRASAAIPRDILVFSAFLGMGLFVYEVVRSRKSALLHLEQIESESEARRTAEEQLKVLVESSPVAIFTADANGAVLQANGAAHRLFGVTPGSLPGKYIRQYLPSLVNVPSPETNGAAFRTVMQCRGLREDGEAFLADIWFSTYRTSAGSRLAAMVVDTSEDLRNREEYSLHQLLAASRILVGAVSHEVRNVCGAIAVVHENLARNSALAQNKDFEALGTLIETLEKIAALELRQAPYPAARVDLPAFLEELRIVIEPALREDGVDLVYDIEPGLPPVWADRQSLMQVFLNLSKNSQRAMDGRPSRVLKIRAANEAAHVAVRVTDTGSGVLDPSHLFRPFQPGAQATGLGVYLSRALLRSFHGDLRYEPGARTASDAGATFVVELSPAPAATLKENHAQGGVPGSVQGSPDSAGGRSHPVPRQPQPAVAD